MFLYKMQPEFLEPIGDRDRDSVREASEAKKIQNRSVARLSTSNTAAQSAGQECFTLSHGSRLNSSCCTPGFHTHDPGHIHATA
jgi:hypothetical protein